MRVEVDSGGATAVTAVSDTSQRVALATRLLDDGADVRDGHPLHVLLGRNQHDFAAEAPLLERLLDAGADVLVMRAEQTLTDRGVPFPPPEQ